MPNNYRLAKVSSLLKKEITFILQNDLENDLIRDHFVNISKIDLSGDLQHCKIYITSSAQDKVREDIVLDKELSVLKLLDELKNKNQNKNNEDKDANS